MESRRVKRRRFYAHIQRLYAKDRGVCADHILSGKWERQGASCPKEKLVEFWAPLFETQSVPDDRVVTPVTTTRNDLTSPILVAEVDSATRNSKSKGSPGPDGLRLFDAKALSSRGLAVHFNLWMLLACSPTRFRVGRTTLIPKKADSVEPGDFRPITVTSVLVRLFHKVLATRLEVSLPLSIRQKAFRRGDRLAANVYILRSIINDHKLSKKPLSMSFIAVAKAFDSVSQHSVISAASRLGMHELLLRYIRSSY